MKLWHIIVGVLMVLATVGGATAGSYYYSFDSDIEGITIFSMESWGTLIGTLYWSELYGGSLNMGGDYAISIGAGNSTQFFEVGDKLTINFVLNETNYDDHSIGMHFAFCNESYTDFNTGFGYGVDTAIGCTSTYRYNPVTLTNQSGNYFYDDNIYKYVFAKPIDSVSEHYYSLIINRIDSIMFDVAVLDKNTSDYYYSVFNLSDKIGGSNYWFVFGGFSDGASGQWRIFVQDMNLSTSGECVEDWLANYFNQSCNGTYINEIKYYIDNNLCNTTINLPLDNGTISNSYPCSNCTENWICSHYLSCLINNIKYCNNATDLNMCGTNYTGDYSEFTAGCNYCSINQCRYTASDVPKIAGDVIGTAGVNFKVWIPLLILALVLGGIGTAVYAIRHFKRK